MNKRVLLIAFHFPPQAASSGIQRTLSFSRYLGGFAWEPLVLSAHPRAYSQQNPSQLASIPEDIVVRRAFALDAKHHLGYKGRYLALTALPDRWTSWALGAIPAGLSLIRRYKPEVIWSTFPISTAHLIGLVLHRITGLPWVADFRDPMMQPSYPVIPMQRRMYRWIERQAVMRCTTAVFTTHGAMEDYRRRFPDVSPAKFRVIENGYDEDIFDAQPAAPAGAGDASRRLTLLHSGVLYQDGRDPAPFLQALAHLKEAGKATPDTLRVVLRAPGDLDGTRACVAAAGVADLVEVAAPVTYREAVSEMLAADGLMVFQGTPFNAQIPAKLYEYFRARKPIIGLLDPAGETARVLGKAGCNDIAHIDSPDAIAAALERFLTCIAKGRAKVASEEVIRSASRRNRARELALVLDAAAQGARQA
ncbi:glycosyltransferase [Massilia sp. G4R7]|uniref:Glycosyltransferase n=1 Tax=Massilia phyllostachyos TaxID=2898585 RepID=A0ABS8QCA3_9BURK|nr:glycosyltransferase [Massilia phyllostachyos]MCD2519392.1 glycosyltransferase [Massilia phyllostachyos]